MANQEINFFYEAVSYTFRSVSLIKSWIFSICLNEKKVCRLINIILCNDAYLLELNKKYLNHNYLTDILTFASNESSTEISGDIYISVEMAFENAKRFKTLEAREIERLIAHGVLHLFGYLDESKEDQLLMTSKEDYYLSLLEKL
ncbi:MAG: rRNA maturation RNase YbeY [Bacteroidetes bacterium]|nr:rRNA maturation RNase YbeY [Bacteroidota bacterium]